MTLPWSRHYVVLLCVLALAMAGCRTQQLVAEHGEARMQLKKAMWEQVIDNLIAAKRGDPVLQVAFVSLKGTIQQRATGRYQDVHTSGYFSGVDARATSDVQTPFFEAYQENAFVIDVVPVTNADDIYKAYDVAAAVPTFLQSDEKPSAAATQPATQASVSPKDSECIFKRKVGDTTYWVERTPPNRARFYRLYQQTSVMRQPKPTVVPAMITTTITGLIPTLDDDGRPRPRQPIDPTVEPDLIVEVNVRLKDKVEQENGNATILLNGEELPVPYLPYDPPLANRPATDAIDTITLRIPKRFITQSDTLEKLVNSPIQVTGFYVTMPVTPTEEQLQTDRINSRIEDLRIQTNSR